MELVGKVHPRTSIECDNNDTSSVLVLEEVVRSGYEKYDESRV
jgi:hypothetical protein